MDDGAVDIAIHLALLHTGFNGVVTGIFGLFPRPILWLVRKLVPGEGIRGFKSPLVTASVMDAPEPKCSRPSGKRSATMSWRRGWWSR